MYAIVETGGKQYRVEEGQSLRVEKLAGEAGDKVQLDKVLMLGGDSLKLGSPYLDGASVDCKIENHGKGKKIVIGKFKSKKGYKRKQGHRQPYTQILVEKING